MSFPFLPYMLDFRRAIFIIHPWCFLLFFVHPRRLLHFFMHLRSLNLFLALRAAVFIILDFSGFGLCRCWYDIIGLRAVFWLRAFLLGYVRVLRFDFFFSHPLIEYLIARRKFFESPRSISFRQHHILYFATVAISFDCEEFTFKDADPTIALAGCALSRCA